MSGRSFYTQIRTFLILFGITLIASYALFQARNLIVGPVIAITEPVNGSLIREPLIEIRGTARNIAEIKLNDRNIAIDENGMFNEQLLLAPGYTIMKLSAQDRFGRTTNATLELYYQI